MIERSVQKNTFRITHGSLQFKIISTLAHWRRRRVRWEVFKIPCTVYCTVVFVDMGVERVSHASRRSASGEGHTPHGLPPLNLQYHEGSQTNLTTGQNVDESQVTSQTNRNRLLVVSALRTTLSECVVSCRP